MHFSYHLNSALFVSMSGSDTNIVQIVCMNVAAELLLSQSAVLLTLLEINSDKTVYNAKKHFCYSNTSS